MPEDGSGVSPQNKSSWAAFLKSVASFNGDLFSMTAPPFILSSASLTEFSAYWAEHPSLFVAPAAEQDPAKRFLLVVKWFLSTLKQQYASRSEKFGNEKKPLNPFLGELFLGEWKDESGVTTLISEQVCHHPPVTAYRISNKTHGVFLEGYNSQRASFSRTINVRQIGRAILTIPSFNDTYLISLPSLHIEGLLFGCPFVELNDQSYITSSSGYTARIDYSGKGWLGGKRNSFSTIIYPSENEKDILYSVSGQWSKAFEIREGKRGDIFEKYDTEALPITSLTVAPIEKQSPLESRRAWQKVAAGIQEGNMTLVAEQKRKIEEEQRALRIKEKESGKAWESRYFSPIESDPVVEELGGKLSLMLDTDKNSGGMWKFDEEKASKFVSTANEE
ncbi:Protein HES1 [Golovinomyces cichoracearum]|uniref:Protein HES1 n=1 Tax=Golovinomyces cichoracearum TaxID=62708 RepID=A0A420HFV6_9PEZI|nr:Protein HES1 [Golovinomyces cichoracearum]